MPEEKKPEPEDDEPGISLADLLEGEDDEKTEMDKIFEHLLNPENIAQLTDLSGTAIAAFTVAAPILARRNMPAYAAFFKANLIYRVSKTRQGRKELTRIVSRQFEKEDEKDVKAWGMMGRRRGMGR